MGIVDDPLHLDVWVVFSSDSSSSDERLSVLAFGGTLFEMVDTFPPLRIRRLLVPTMPGKLIFPAESPFPI